MASREKKSACNGVELRVVDRVEGRDKVRQTAVESLPQHAAVLEDLLRRERRVGLEVHDVLDAP